MLRLIVATHLIAAIAANPIGDGRIVGGENVSIVDFPYQLSMQYHGQHICGASIISEKYALTAAHCTDGMAPSVLTLVAGISKQAESGQRHKVAKIHQNPHYNRRNMDSDISVVQIEGKFQFNNKVQPVPLAGENDDPEDGVPVVVTGWGYLWENGPLPDHLQGVAVKIVSRETCAKDYYPAHISKNMICAAFVGKDACQGDSGGPLITTKNQVGVVSWAYGCADPKYPGVYSNVASLRKFIKDVAGV